MKNLMGAGVHFGMDPEVFLVKDGLKRLVPVGSERVLTGPLHSELGGGTIVTDGVQLEIHPVADPCRANLSNKLANCMKALRELQRSNKGLKISFAPMVTVPKLELAGLSPKAQNLGCEPSFNIYGHESPKVNGLVYRKRTAAGHIHLGSGYIDHSSVREGWKKGIIKPSVLVPLLDLIVGIPCVLLDRDPAQKERRKLYGRAGEFRLPPHGLEYRTLGNFWLRNYALMSFVLGQCRIAVNAAYTHAYFEEHKMGYGRNQYALDFAPSLIKAVDPKVLQKAINSNDFDLAWKIYSDVVKPALKTITTYEGLASSSTIGGESFTGFEHLVKMGLDHYFPGDPLAHWCAKQEGHGRGWESHMLPLLIRDANKARADERAAAAPAVVVEEAPQVPVVLTGAEVTQAVKLRRKRVTKKMVAVGENGPAVDVELLKAA